MPSQEPACPRCHPNDVAAIRLNRAVIADWAIARRHLSNNSMTEIPNRATLLSDQPAIEG